MPEERISRLKVPDGWAEQYAQQRSPELFTPTSLEVSQIRLSVDPRRSYGCDLKQVAKDLCAGIIVERRGRQDDPYFVLHGTWHQIFAAPSVGLNSRATVARVTSIKAGTGFSRRDPVQPGQVSFDAVWDEASCDLAELTEAYETSLAVLRGRRVAIEQARAALLVSGPEVSQHGELHRIARRHYAPLQTALELLQVRSDLAGRVETAAVVVGATEDVLDLRLAEPVKLFEGRPVSLSIGGRQYTLPLLMIDGDICALPQPRDALAAGEHVRLVQQARFARSKNKAALNSFLNGQVEGRWEHLATLLCRPWELAQFQPVKPSRWLSGIDLNQEQQAAVAGALSTPHAFLIQGPPGTGKTTVITELVLQLVARGERVLLLAPMHVAVDEVLRRIADRPQVFPIRLAYDDTKVSDDLRRFLLPQVSAEYLRRARAPVTAQGQRWQAEGELLDERRRAVQAYLDAAEAEAATSTAYRTWEKDFQQSWKARTQALQAAVQALTYFSDQAVIEADQLATELARQLGAASGGQRLASRLRRFVGIHDDLQQLIAQAAGAARKAARLADERSRWRDEQLRAQVALDDLVRDREDRGGRLHTAWQAAQQQLILAADESPLPGGSDPRAVLTELDQQISTLRWRVQLEQRWFDMAPHDDPGSLQQELRSAANVFCCTTTGVTADALRGLDFDTLIIDEASRVIDSEFLIGANRARRWILVGDEHQLPPYVEPEDEYHLHALAALQRADQGDDLPTVIGELAAIWADDEELHAFRTSEVLRTATALRADETWEETYRSVMDTPVFRSADRVMLQTVVDHLVHSLFERLVKDGRPELRQRLTEQRRMIEPIAALVREPVYGGDYRTATDLDVRPLVSPAFEQPVTLLDTSSQGLRAQHQQYRNGCFNELEIRWIVETCRGWEQDLRSTGTPRVTVSVLTFYRHQATLLRQALGWPTFREFRALKFLVVDAIDKIQGQEADLVLISFCRTYLGPGPRRGAGLWLQDPRRLNVACTRARRALVLVGHGDTLRGLRGVPAAERFYENLFQRLDDEAGYRSVQDRR